MTTTDLPEDVAPPVPPEPPELVEPPVPPAPEDSGPHPVRAFAEARAMSCMNARRLRECLSISPCYRARLSTVKPRQNSAPNALDSKPFRGRAQAS